MLNQNIFYFFYNLSHQSSVFDWLIVFFANTFGYLLIVAAFVFLVLFKNGHFDSKNFSLKYNFMERFREITFITSSVLIAWIIATVLKSIIKAPRPFIFFNNLQPLFTHGGFDSFPSGHATFFLALAVSLYYLNKRVGLFFVIGALLIGLARITAGVHFPIDIICGYVIGFFIPFVLNLIFKRKNS